MGVVQTLSINVNWMVLTLSLCGLECAINGPQTPTTDPPIPGASQSVSSTVDESERLLDWLTRYGYLPRPEPSTGQLQAWTAVTQALKAMQKFAGLDDTGTLDVDTLRLIQTPRCSLPDDEAIQLASGTDAHNKRMTRAIKTWARRNINWRLHSYPISSALSREMTRSLVYYALKVWAEPTSLEFHEVGGPDGADLQIDFLYGFHGDEYPFDGVGGAIGHAFFPSDSDRAGQVHLDAKEAWAFRKPDSEGTDTFTVLVHELGHALGLSHSSARGSVMRPYYQGPLGDPLHFTLGPLDQEIITALYGKRGDQLQTDSSPSASEAQQKHQHGDTHRLTYIHRHMDSHTLDRCNTSFDAVAKIRGETFFFKGQSMWRVNRGNLVSKIAVSVRRLWAALPSSLPPLRAVLERPDDHAIIFISGAQFWLFKDLSLQDGFPQPLSALRPGGSDGKRQGLHWNADEGVVWGSRPERKVEDGQMWTELIEGGVNGIITGDNSSLYLFKGDSYWKFAHSGSVPDKSFPRPVSTDWLDCPDPLSHQPDDISLTLESKEEGKFDQIRHKDETTTRHRDCPCFNRAVQPNTRAHLVALILLLYTFTHLWANANPNSNHNA